MPQPNLNNVATQATYVDALTVLFPFARTSFSANAAGQAIYYRLAWVTEANGRDVQWEANEHYLLPSMSNFQDAQAEGLPAGALFKGIQIRSGGPVAATVSVN